MAKKPITLKQFIINNLRRCSYKWGPKQQAKKKSKIGYNQYVCNACKKVFPNKDIKLDHVLPVVCPVNGFTNWDDYINRMFCDETGFQTLCNLCHDQKTAIELEIRKLNRNKV